MSTKHTMGPWRSEPCHRSGYTVWGGTDAAPVCVVDTQDYEDRFGTIKNEADARLIAAAPDLLEALWVCMEHNRLHHGNSHNTVIQALAAIAKAEGTE